MSVVKIVKIIPVWDMRQRHLLRTGIRARKLKTGEVLIAFNRTRKMARIIDSVGGLHDYYAVSGQFNIASMKKLLKAGLYVDLKVGRNEQRKVVSLGLAA